MQDVNQQAYDRGSTIFSPDGRLYQVEYAREAVKRGTAALGVRTDEGVVLVADKRVRSPLMERDSVEKLHAIDDHLGVASAGHVADGRRLVDSMRRDAQVNRVRYGERLDAETATKHVTEFVQRYTQVGGARPFGVALLVAGVDRDGTPRLFETDPSGTSYEWRAVAVGADRAVVQEYLAEQYDDGLDLDGGIELALRALAAPEDADDLDAVGVGVATVDAESERYVRLTDDEVAEYLDGIEFAAAADEDEETTEDDEASAEGDDAAGDDAEEPTADDGDDADDAADDPDAGAE